MSNLTQAQKADIERCRAAAMKTLCRVSRISREKKVNISPEESEALMLRIMEHPLNLAAIGRISRDDVAFRTEIPFFAIVRAGLDEKRLRDDQSKEAQLLSSANRTSVDIFKSLELIAAFGITPENVLSDSLEGIAARVLDALAQQLLNGHSLGNDPSPRSQPPQEDFSHLPKYVQERERLNVQMTERMKTKMKAQGFKMVP